jgi:hypothetical protein
MSLEDFLDILSVFIFVVVLAGMTKGLFRR